MLMTMSRSVSPDMSGNKAMVILKTEDPLPTLTHTESPLSLLRLLFSTLSGFKWGDAGNDVIEWVR